MYVHYLEAYYYFSRCFLEPMWFLITSGFSSAIKKNKKKNKKGRGGADDDATTGWKGPMMLCSILYYSIIVLYVVVVGFCCCCCSFLFSLLFSLRVLFTNLTTELENLCIHYYCWCWLSGSFLYSFVVVVVCCSCVCMYYMIMGTVVASLYYIVPVALYIYNIISSRCNGDVIS